MAGFVDRQKLAWEGVLFVERQAGDAGQKQGEKVLGDAPFADRPDDEIHIEACRQRSSRANREVESRDSHLQRSADKAVYAGASGPQGSVLRRDGGGQGQVRTGVCWKNVVRQIRADRDLYSD